MVHYFHERLGHGKRMAIYDGIKREYANITLNCVLLYMAGCQGCYSTGPDPAQLSAIDNTTTTTTNNNSSSQVPMQEPTPRTKQLAAEKTVESRAAVIFCLEISYEFVIYRNWVWTKSTIPNIL